MEIKMNFTKNEMKTIEKLHKAYNKCFTREDQYEVNGPIRFSVNHVEGEAIVTLALYDTFFCDVLDIATRNTHLIKSFVSTAKALYELSRSTVNILEGELKAVCGKYKNKPQRSENNKMPYGSFVSADRIEEMNHVNKAA